MATSGSIESLSLAGQSFPVAADNEATIMFGGASNEVQLNGDGITARIIKSKVPWKISGLQVSIDWARGDMATLQNLADGNVFAVQMKLADQTLLNAVGQIVGDLAGSSQNSTASVELSGGGKITS